MEYLPFDNMADLYDETRVFDKDCFNAALDFLVGRFPPETFRQVFEPGVGTGRVAIPLAERGYQVIGVDISEEMLAILEKRVARSGQSLKLSFHKADVLKLPFSVAVFDMAVIVHLFYFIRDWKRAASEILRVLRGDAPVVLMHTGTGTEVPVLNERYKELCAEQDYLIQESGAKSTTVVVNFFISLGYSAKWIRDRWQWTSRIRLDKALGYLESRAYSFASLTPPEVHSKTMTKLKSKLRRQFGSLATEVEVPNQVYLVILSKE
jgi:ubiquinone/menaquinone biosynthesis C-methylase UbiE